MQITIEKQTKVILDVADAATVTVVDTPDSMAITVNNRSDGWLKKAYSLLNGVFDAARRRKAQRRWIVGFDKARAEKL
ncbi:hypothetical protein [Prevotella pallens]|uniref:hypothetical protein n=1 Tax=Prevotella pallens TaxID=60133 RepID=UPI001CAF6315|nr:hypothetical protein [Prevotella pallens]MBF1495310.1 hypothetical protein [Prevotella pallens]